MSFRTYMRDKFLTKEESERLEQKFTVDQGGSLQAAREGVFLSGTRIKRQDAVSLPSVMAVVRLLSEESADKLMSGSLRVVNRDMEEQNTPYFRKVVDLLQSPNSFNSGRSFLQDMFADFLLDGNALCYVDRNPRGVPFRLLRCVPEESSVEHVGAEQVYRIQLANGQVPGIPQVQPVRNVVHSLWPRMEGGQYSEAWRNGMGTSPLRAIESTLKIAILMETQLRTSLEKGMSIGGKTVFEYPEGEIVNEQQVKALQQGVQQTGKDPSRPYITDRGAKVKFLESPPIGEQAQLIRQYQVKEVFRAYGLPETLGGVEINYPGQGIAQLAKLYEKFCADLHLKTFLEGFSKAMLTGNAIATNNYPRVRIVADRQGPSLADSTDLVNLYNLMGSDIRRPAITLEEFRAIAGLPPEQGPEDDRMRLAQRPVAGARESEPGSVNPPNRRGDRNSLRLEDLVNGERGVYNGSHEYQ